MYSVSAKQEDYIKSYRKRERTVGFFRFFILVAFLALWEVTAKTGLIDEFIFSCPSAMFKAAVYMGKDGSLWYHIGITAAETIVGFLLGTIIGTAAAVLLWWNKMISDVAQPYLVVLNSLPKTALAPIIIVWLGNNTKSIILIALLTSVIITIMTVLSGFIETDKDKIKLVTIFGGNKRQILTRVVIPSNIPVIFNALKINVGLSFVGVIVGEFLVGKAGLGYLIVYSSQIFKLDNVMMSVTILAIMAAVMYKAITFIEDKYIKR
ncbi:MAG: ABC transporter permease [Candidatus Metalachnospira sp.]|nr:ABC transporter permease [Candidatus Metalachnospira sp.]